MRADKAGRLGHRRVAVQGAATLSFLLTPFVRVQGDSLFRIDTASRTLVLLGRPHPLEQMFLLLLLSLFLLFAFLLITVAFGRLWCGWACPQTTLTDLTDAVGRVLAPLPPLMRSALFHVICASLGLLVGANLIWYFLSPPEFFRLLGSAALPPPAALALCLVAIAVYVDLAFIRRTLCRSLCPYGRFQATLADSGTMTLRLLPNAEDLCIDCGACQRACPTGIDIRNSQRGEQVECIACGRCVDACTAVLTKRGQSGVISYRFGRDNRLFSLLTFRTGLLLCAALGALFLLFFEAARWHPVSLTVRRSAAPERRLADGRKAVFFSTQAANRGTSPLLLELRATASGTAIALRGPVTNLALAPGKRLQVDAAIVLPQAPGAGDIPLVFTLQDHAGTQVAECRTVVRGDVP